MSAISFPAIEGAKEERRATVADETHYAAIARTCHYKSAAPHAHSVRRDGRGGTDDGIGLKENRTIT